MYSKLARSSSGFAAKFPTRNYATRRVMKESQSATLPISTRSFQSSGQHRGQAALAESPSYQEVFDNDIINEGPFPGSIFPQTSFGNRSVSDLALDHEVKTPTAFTENKATSAPVTQLHHRGMKYERVPYWQQINRWRDVTEKEFLTHSWNVAKNIQGSHQLYKFLNEVLPEKISASEQYQHIQTREAFIEDVVLGIKEAPMSIRLTPHILSMIDWQNPLEDPLRRQFIPMKSTQLPDHPELTLDSLHEADDSPVPGLVHRYNDKALLLATSACGQYCRYCTRSYAVGGNTSTVTKNPNKPIKSRWDAMLSYIRSTPTLNDIVVSGGDSYYLSPDQLRYIGDALLDIPHIRRFRIASKGICFSPSRTLDPEDEWTDELVRLSKRGRERGVQVALHTHFNHVNEISWVTREAAQRLFAEGVVVRNQSVLLRGVNDDVATMSALIRELADMNVQPYYVYQCDMVRGVEDLRTPLSTILTLEQNIRGSIAGFMIPSFVVDLPGGGGKRLAASFESYERETGRSTFLAPAVSGRKEKVGKVYEYWDPLAYTGENFVGRGGRGA